ncbi:MAG TPA: class I SAM-dependent methyltransferase [Paracoccaceae bacterium]|nr:class I SAM-dependent methyltransferase [Paracoccaceae bacterium]
MDILALFDGLDRCAPGDAVSVARASAGVAEDAAVLDAGCGRGADLPALMAVAPRGRIVAVDVAAPFVAHVQAAFPGVRAVCGDMASPPGGPFDLIWSGGAIYALGVTAALRAWTGHLCPGGRVAFSDLVLRGDAPAPDVAAFFAAEGVALRGEAALRAEVAAAGFRVIDAFWMPGAAWEAYYRPLETRLTAAAAASDAADTRTLVEGFRQEIDLWRRHGGDYGYLVVVADRP